MTLPVFLHVGTPERGRIWGQHLAAAIPGMETRQWPDIGDPAEIGYVGAWTLPQGLLDGLPNLRFLLSVGAGVDQLDLSVVPEGLPVLRMVDPALAEGMTEYVTAGFCPCTATCTITAQPHKGRMDASPSGARGGPPCGRSGHGDAGSVGLGGAGALRLPPVGLGPFAP
jgi:glyoxylate/hydroxypyruvate reductase A